MKVYIIEYKDGTMLGHRETTCLVTAKSVLSLYASDGRILVIDSQGKNKKTKLFEITLVKNEFKTKKLL